MPLSAGSKLGPYEIAGPLGAGGMGEVYRARDTRLGRTVAVKVLPSHLSASPEQRQRLDREARAISQLSHPNICHLYDVGHHNGIDFLVMEYLDGETLADRLKRGPLPLDQLLKIGVEIAEALEQAHRQDIVHRDLKPGNVMLTKGGAKLMDFGLAKQAARAGGGEALTLTMQPLTSEGTLLGTFQYMSPEQMEGKDADARSDLFAFGALLYEMATGKRAFEGKTPASVIASVIEREPAPISVAQPASPLALDRIVRGCLAKDPNERWQSAHDVRLQLSGLQQDLRAAAPKAATTAHPSSREKLAWLMVAALIVLAALLAAVNSRRPADTSRPIRAALLPPNHWSFLVNGAALSPDGTRLAFVAVGPNGENSLWVRHLSAGGNQEFFGTQNAKMPFWSPDSSRIGFFADGKLKIVDAAGGVPRTLGPAPFGRGGTWNRDGVIVYQPDLYGTLFRISENGGTPAQVTKLPRAGSGQSHSWPFFLPDGNHFLFSIDWSSPEDSVGNGIYVGSIDGAAPKLVTPDFTTNPQFASGKLLYVRDLTLVAQPFDSSRLEVTGPAVPVTEQQIATNDSFSVSAFSISQTGILVFQAVSDLAPQLVWFDASGKELGPLAATSPRDPHLSPDGRSVAFVSDENRNGRYYLRVYDLARDVSTRLTDRGYEAEPAWSSDGKKIVYQTRDGKTYFVYQVAADGSSPPELVLKGPRRSHFDWTRDGRLVFADFSAGRPSLAVYSPKDRKVSEIRSRGAEPRISPDGHWLLCTTSSGQTFHPEIFLQPFPGPGPNIQISRGGGAQATWSHDGKRIFFIAADSKMMAVDFDRVHQSVSPPRALFQTRIIAPSFAFRQYDVAPDGRFLINSLPPGSAPPMTLVTNWNAQLNR